MWQVNLHRGRRIQASLFHVLYDPNYGSPGLRLIIESGQLYASPDWVLTRPPALGRSAGDQNHKRCVLLICLRQEPATNQANPNGSKVAGGHDVTFGVRRFSPAVYDSYRLSAGCIKIRPQRQHVHCACALNTGKGVDAAEQDSIEDQRFVSSLWIVGGG